MPTADVINAGVDFVMGAPGSRDLYKGVSNPYGQGASAFEPNTEIYTPGTDPLMRGSSMQLSGYDAVDKAASDKATADSAATGANAQSAQTAAGAPVANGSVLSFINAAKTLIGKPYVWGGTTANGTDCSGLLYYAFNAAGIKMPRYRASDYGHMGMQVSAQDALPGDVVYWDEPGSTDHVGIYLGNGLVLNSPHSGTTTQINHVWGNPVYRRIITDSGFGQLAQPSGPPIVSYQGTAANTVFTGQYPTDATGVLTIPPTGYVPGGIAPGPSTPNNIGRSRAI